MSNKENFLNCYQDLQRAAVSYIKNPKGSTHILFIDHALKILEKLGDRKANLFKIRIVDLKRKLKSTKKASSHNLADEILTIGLLLKPS
ncbi:hypothetical protein A2865_02710 [Candidatus Woesebacteria bacterium RIFCSPHIGHO2_01_FULL_39_17]|uniref:Uncharacterized protein n=3 Tax=Candidatus Woeseibacteriota TaxID=1752722 RepID=A0A0G0QSF0_9BACT|nr:MAG: hypothetical protein US72_C0004G0078 [Microgenomates group bacterium GW2011_GWC1_38_12]KKQ93369.1 MAG: hypothetical protein UT19_C0013G0033 [Candidatus Woesebacteria bacterium GW2011_GWB1_39_10b]KKR13295.1 MAG: hypothetical protein UT40_C0020G0016 [Candidatus Woesebacteria bacterium GW2011_GWA1_39_21b]OGM23215.1 MAG: hypothetical protein A2865_02710 [Candidatus Woesebacteria bacterium RIFCSPHIGHO2_01_FULL_39_17]OGM61129.1 MAG: hypothetical protein A3A52_04025 [Candidatus Woesebacteria b